MLDGASRSAQEVVADACARVGLAARGAVPLHVHSNAVFLLPAEGAVARVGSGFEAVDRACRAVTVTRFLASIGFPCVVPLAVDQPVVVTPGTPVTFWEHVPVWSDRLAPAADLAGLLRDLHSLADTPTLPALRPMARLLTTIEQSRALDGRDRRWLIERAHQLLDRYAELAYPLGPARLVHGDAQLSNVLLARDGRVLLGDWDATCVAPREWDLVMTASEDRFGMPIEERRDFAGTYGYDVTTWPDWTVLRDLKELHSLGAHIRRAPTSAPHARELRWRLASLRAGDRRRWHALG